METPPQHRTILWADDDKDDVYLFNEALKEVAPEHRLILFSNGRELLDYLECYTSTHLPCMILLDMNMPVLNGKETLALLKEEEKWKSIPVVVFTTSSNQMDRQFCKQYGTEMITKPTCFEALREVVKRIVSPC